MPAKHQLSNAEVITRGDVGYKPYMATKELESRRGVIVPDLAVVEYGAVVTADADGVCASQSITAASGGTINGALATDGVATFDVPRNVVAAWTTTAVMTVTGTDEYGQTIVESSASGTSMTGKKAFKTVTAVEVSTDVTGATVGTGDVLGLPYRIDGKGQIICSSADGSVEDATIAVADTTDPATATDGDVRGTVDFTTASDGTVEFTVLMVRTQTSDPTEMFGVDQYSG